MRNHTILRRAVTGLLATLLLTISLIAPTGCAIFNRNNTPVFNTFEDNLVPENEVAVIATFPVTFPLGILSLLIDQFIVRPFQIADDSARDMKEFMWDELEWDEQYVAETALVPWRILFTGLFFPLDYLGRLFLDIPQYGDNEDTPPPTPEELREQEIERLKIMIGSENRQQEDFQEQINRTQGLIEESQRRQRQFQSELDQLLKSSDDSH